MLTDKIVFLLSTRSLAIPPTTKQTSSEISAIFFEHPFYKKKCIEPFNLAITGLIWNNFSFQIRDVCVTLISDCFLNE